MVREDALDDSISGVLKADDYVMLSYHNGRGQSVDLFVAYYQAQGSGESMHSPKNCLPGSGWDVVTSDEVALWPDRPGNPTMINRYVVENKGERALVLYWYQANGRVIASEYWGKIYLVLDTLRTGQRSGAIVRFITSIPKGSEGTAELQSSLELARTTAPILPKYLPN
jgi:EpsI family protein